MLARLQHDVRFMQTCEVATSGKMHVCSTISRQSLWVHGFGNQSLTPVIAKFSSSAVEVIYFIYLSMWL